MLHARSRRKIEYAGAKMMLLVMVCVMMTSMTMLSMMASMIISMERAS
jgi:hypothetical protein